MSMIVGAVLLFPGYHSAASINDFIAFYWSGNGKNTWFLQYLHFPPSQRASLSTSKAETAASMKSIQLNLTGSSFFNTSRTSDTQKMTSYFLPRCTPACADRRRPAECEDVRMWGCGTSSRACSYTSPADLWPHKLSEPQEELPADPSAGAFTFITLHLSNPPSCNAALWENAWLAETLEIQTGWLMLLLPCSQSVIVVFCFPSPDFEDLFDDDDIQWLMPAQDWWMIFAPLLTSMFFVVFFLLSPSWEQTDYLLSNDIQFPFIVVLVPGFFFFRHRLQMSWDS